MSKIHFEESELNNLINTGLTNSINKLNDAINLSSQLYIPYDFNYRNYLKSLDESIRVNLDSINSVIDIIISGSKKFSSIDDELISTLAGIENYSISLRKTAIK